MKLLKRVVSPVKGSAVGHARSFFSWGNWQLLLILLLVAVLIGAVAYLLKKRRASRKPEKPVKIRPPKGASTLRLKKVWKAFLRQLPWDLRRAVMVFQHFVVMGESGAGKSALIDNHTDWHGHARQFYPSYTASPLLQIYLGSKVLVQELPATLLNDTSENGRLALLKLWRPLFRRKNPIAVVVMNAATLLSDDPEHLKQAAQLIRGKINLLSRIRRQPTTVRLALTNMDQFEGFSSLVGFLHGHNMPLTIDLAGKTDAAGLSKCLEPYEEHLTAALIALPPDRYLRAITFLRRAPKLLQQLAVFIELLKKPDPLSPEPKVVSASLTSQVSGNPLGATPFATSLTAKALQKFNPLFRHKIIATAVALAGIVFLSSVFFYEHHLIGQRFRQLTALEAAPPARYDDVMHQLFVDPITRMRKHTMTAILPAFFPHIDRRLDRRCVEDIRKFYLLPELERISEEEAESKTLPSALEEGSQLQGQSTRNGKGGQDKPLYLLGLIYATRDNGLGTLILDHLKVWSGILALPTQLIEDYVNDNDSAWHVSLNIQNLAYHPGNNITDDPQAWMVYFTEMSGLCQKLVLSRAQFDKMQKEATDFLSVIQELERYDLSVKVTDLLKKETPLGLDLTLFARKDADIRQGAVRQFLSFISSSSITYPKITDDLTLSDLIENLKVMLRFQEGDSGNDQLLQFRFGGETFKFSTQQWSDLLSRSEITLFIRDFIRHHNRHDGMLFFSPEKEFDDITLNASNNGQFLLTGQATVDGRFTKDALERRVKPVLTNLPAFISSLPIPEGEKSYFSDFMLKEVNAYGSRYADAYRNFYGAFTLKADSLDALRYILTQLTSPDSQFMDMLQTVKDNTAVAGGENPYLQALANQLAPFACFQHVMAEQKGVYPELDKYKALLQQMQTDIQQPKAVTEQAGEAASLNPFKNRLPPIARISFAMYRNEPGSYLNLIQAWLKSDGVPSPWQKIFLSPAYAAYSLGMEEIETEIAAIWKNLWEADIHPLQNKFPFDPISETDVSLATLKNAADPFGNFWQSFQRLLAPVCTETDGRWHERDCVLGIPKLPESMLPTVNAVERLTRTLWDKNGNIKPLEFMIKAAPLPRRQPDGPIAVLDYLQAGDSSIFGFNQQPDWQTFKYQWGHRSAAAVGVEFTNDAKSQKAQASVMVPKSNWSFYHLLQKTEDFSRVEKYYDSSTGAQSTWSFANPEGTAGGSHILSWGVTPPSMAKKKGTVAKNTSGPGLSTSEGQAGNRTLDVKFGIKADPWALFRLPQ